MLTEIQDRGTQDMCVVVCDGLKGLPEAIADVWPQAIVQTCVPHDADFRVMPAWLREALSAAVIGLARSA